MRHVLWLGGEAGFPLEVASELHWRYLIEMNFYWTLQPDQKKAEFCWCGKRVHRRCLQALGSSWSNSSWKVENFQELLQLQHHNCQEAKPQVLWGKVYLRHFVNDRYSTKLIFPSHKGSSESMQSKMSTVFGGSIPLESLLFWHTIPNFNKIMAMKVMSCFFIQFIHIATTFRRYHYLGCPPQPFVHWQQSWHIPCHLLHGAPKGVRNLSWLRHRTWVLRCWWLHKMCHQWMRVRWRLHRKEVWNST